MPDFLDQFKIEQPDFSQKTYFDDRMAIIAIKHEHRVTSSSLAKAFGLSISTIRHICNLHPNRITGYESVHKEFLRLGPVESYRMYVKPHHLERVASFIKE
jgi:hypothetical protein